MKTLAKKVSPFFTALLIPIVVIAVSAARDGWIWGAVFGLCAQLIFNSIIEIIRYKTDFCSIKCHIIKVIFAELVAIALIWGDFNTFNTNERGTILFIIIYGIVLLIGDVLTLKKKPSSEDEETWKKSGLRLVLNGSLCLHALFVVLCVILILFPVAPKAPYSWAGQIKKTQEINDLEDAVILFGRETCPGCIEAERYLRGQSKSNRKALYYFDTDRFRQDDIFQEVLQKYHVESVPALVVIIGGTWVDTYSVVGRDNAIDENAIEEAFYQYHLGKEFLINSTRVSSKTPARSGQ